MRKRLGMTFLLAAVLLSRAVEASITQWQEPAATPTPMPPAPGAVDVAPARQLRLNGFPLYVVSGSTAASIQEVTSFFETHLLPSRPVPGAPRPILWRRIGTSSANLIGVSVPHERVLALLRSDPSALLHSGALRMVAANQTDGKTEYLAIWTEAPIPASVLNPPEAQDAPGEDIPGIPRPPGRRLFSLTEPATGLLLVSYSIASVPEVALRGATEQLRESGFVEDPELRSAGTKLGRQIALATAAAREVVVSAAPDGRRAACAVLTYFARRL